jgi:hypothetical protein
MLSPNIRLVRPVPDPLGLYVRAGRLDHRELQSFIEVGTSGISGVVFEAKRVAHQKELLMLVLERGLDALPPHSAWTVRPQAGQRVDRSPPDDARRSRGTLMWTEPALLSEIDHE